MEQTGMVKMRQVVDWSAAVWAGLVSGLLYLIVGSLLSGILYNNFLLPLKMTAAFIWGSQSILDDPSLGMIILALIVHFILAIFFGIIVAFVIHRWGLAVGVIGGALLGLALYGINFYALTEFFPWFAGMRGTAMIVSHLVFGAAAGGFYELLEVEEFEPIELA